MFGRLKSTCLKLQLIPSTEELPALSYMVLSHLLPEYLKNHIVPFNFYSAIILSSVLFLPHSA